VGRVLRALLPLLLCLLPFSAHAAYRTGITALSASAETATTGVVTTLSGDLAVVMIQTLQTTPITSCTDNYANTFTLREQYAVSVTGQAVYLYVYTVPMTTFGSAETFTCAWGAFNASYALIVGIFSGRNTASPMDGTPGTFGDTAFVQSHTGALVTTADASSDVVEFATDGGSTAAETFTAGSGFTVGQSVLGGSFYSPSMFQYHAAIATGAHAGPWTTANFVEGASVTFALAPSSGASCTHSAWLQNGTIAVPTAGSTQVWLQGGTFGTVDCSSTSYLQPQNGGAFGVN
jgi:hypothetical protein